MTFTARHSERSEESRSLPEGWRWVKLDEVCEFVYGSGLPAHTRQDGKVPVYGSNGIVGHHDEPLTTGPTIIIGRKGSIGEVHFSPVACWPIDTTYYIEHTNIEADLLWLTHWLRALNLHEMNKAAAVPGLNRQDVYAIEIPLPPLAEQRRISAILAEQLAAVDRARAATEAQLQAAKALPSAYLRAVFNSPEAQQWPEVLLSEIAETCSGTTPSRSKLDYYGGSIPWVKTGELVDGAIEDTEEHITELALQETSLKLLPEHTLLIAMYGQGQTRGRTGLLARPATTNQACFAILPKPEMFDTEFLQYWFRHSYTRLRSETEGRGGNQPNLNGNVLRGQRIPLPSLSDQRRIVTTLNERIAMTEQTRKTLEAQLTAINQLPAALLRRAFNGEL
ncbi:MAG: restriction endonuclease subunit S [Blastocatellia bacterium]